MLQRLLPFAHELWTQRELLWQFTLRNVEIRHKGSHLGLAWSFLNPLLLLGLYVFIFGYVFGGTFGVLPNETKADYALGVFLGLTLFHFCSEVMAVAPGVIVSNPNFVKKVVFPLEVLPAANVGAALIHLLISLTFVMISLFAFGHQPGMQLLWLPIVVAPIVLLFLGVSWLFAALGVFLRDLSQAMQFFTMALLFASAIFYPPHKIPPEIWALLRFNPLLLAVEQLRNAVLWEQALNFKHIGYLYCIGLAGCYAGHLVFRRTKPAFADVI